MLLAFTVICIIAWWLLWIGGFKMSGRKRLLWILAWMAISAPSGLYVARAYYVACYPQGKIVTDTVLRVGPDESYGVIGSVQANDAVVIWKTQNGWYKICKEVQQVGWVPQSAVVVVCVEKVVYER